MRVDRSFMVLLAAAAVVVVTSSAGLWQLDRARQKQDLHDAMTARQAMAPLDSGALPCRADDWAAQQHRPARLQGRWLHEHTVYLDNRVMAGRAGFVVLTPLMLDDSGDCEADVVLVQRGWVPRALTDRTQVPALPQPGGTVAVEGVLAPWPSRIYDFGEAGEGVIRQNLDFAAYRASTGLPLIGLSVQQTRGDDDGLLRDWPVVASGVEKHHGYAFQWFGLSGLILLLYVWFQIVQPRRQARRA